MNSCFSFQPQFVDLILGGTKDQTIRPPRKAPPRPGGVVHLFTGLRTQACRKLGTATCTEILPCELSPFPIGGYVRIGAASDSLLRRKGQLLDFARRDGFRTWDELCEFWQDTHGALRFQGTIYRWENLRP